MNIKPSLIFILLFSGIVFGCSNAQEDNSAFQNPAGENSQYPYLFSSGNALYMSWISGRDGDSYALNYSRYSNGEWSKPHTIASDSTWFVNWADFPSVIADENGPVAAHWLNKKAGGPYSYNVNISTAQSPGEWSSPITPHFDSTATEHGFVSMVPWDKETFLAVWLDGRRTADRADDEYYNLNYAMTLRGALISRSGEVKQKFLIDDSVCDCCQTSLIKTDNGAVVAYRNRTGDEIRDIYLSRFDGQEWSEPEVVHNDGWKIGACPVNGPKLATADNRVAVAWHTATDNNPLTKVAISTDGGSRFGSPVTLNSQQSVGRVDASVHNGTTYVSWIEKGENGTYLKVASVTDSENQSEPVTVGKVSESRGSGFPQMEVLGSQLYFAWTDVDSASSSIQSKSIPLPLSE